jgi:hypothetical protein
VDELAPLSVSAGANIMKLLAQLSLIPRGNMFLFLKFSLSMRKGTADAIGALAILHEGLAQLSFDLDLIVLGKNTAIPFESEGVP